MLETGKNGAQDTNVTISHHFFNCAHTVEDRRMKMECKLFIVSYCKKRFFNIATIAQLTSQSQGRPSLM